MTQVEQGTGQSLQVVAGHLGPGSGAAYAVTGDTVNTATRLLAAAGAGETLVSGATYQLTRHMGEFGPLGQIEVKGKALPVTAYRLLGLSARPGSARGLEALGLATPLVGRQDELRQMLDALDRVLRGRAHGVSLVGEPGVGKSRLLREFISTLERPRAFVTPGRSIAMRGGVWIVKPVGTAGSASLSSMRG